MINETYFMICIFLFNILYCKFYKILCCFVIIIKYMKLRKTDGNYDQG